MRQFKGPRFGRAGIRALTGVSDRALLGTAIKPMGLPPAGLAELAYQLALGGIDIIKEDHGLTDQPFAPFAERVPRCAEAVARANRETGYHCLYVPNVTAPADRIVARARQAKDWGAGGVMVAPGLTGWDTLRLLAEDDALALPILCHPALLGTFAVSPDQGMAHQVVFGQLPRLAGADATIFVNYGGRFSFSRGRLPEHRRGDRTAGRRSAADLPDPGRRHDHEPAARNGRVLRPRRDFPDRRRALQPRAGPGREAAASFAGWWKR